MARFHEPNQRINNEVKILPKFPWFQRDPYEGIFRSFFGGGKNYGYIKNGVFYVGRRTSRT